MKRIIVGVSGASGVVMARFLLQALQDARCETHLVMTDAARETWAYEVGTPVDALLSLSDAVARAHVKYDSPYGN